jgi:hypothetical protein
MEAPACRHTAITDLAGKCRGSEYSLEIRIVGGVRSIVQHGRNPFIASANRGLLGRGVAAKILSAAEKLTGKILLASGLEAQWSAGANSDLKRLRMDFTALNTGECASLPSPGVSRVQILLRAPAGFSAQALGFSLPCAAAGMQVTTYADRIAGRREERANFGHVLDTRWRTSWDTSLRTQPRMRTAAR